MFVMKMLPSHAGIEEKSNAASPAIEKQVIVEMLQKAKKPMISNRFLNEQIPSNSDGFFQL